MERLARLACKFISIPKEHWEYLFREIPRLRDMERYVRDSITKRRIITEIMHTPMHGRVDLFNELAGIVRDESYNLQLQQPVLHKACKSAHALAESRGHHTMHIVMTSMDCEAFWSDWTKNMESQEEFFDRAGDNVWLESTRMDELQSLIEREQELMRPLLNMLNVPATAEKRAPNATLPPVAKETRQPKDAEEKWARFRDVNAQQRWRCPGSLRIECTPEEAPLFRQLAQEIRDKRLPEENIKGRFLELLAKIEDANA